MSEKYVHKKNSKHYISLLVRKLCNKIFTIKKNVNTDNIKK